MTQGKVAFAGTAKSAKNIQSDVNRRWKSCFSNYEQRKGFSVDKYKQHLQEYGDIGKKGIKLTPIDSLFKPKSKVIERKTDEKMSDDSNSMNNNLSNNDSSNNNDNNSNNLANEALEISNLLKPDNDNCDGQKRVISEIKLLNEEIILLEKMVRISNSEQTQNIKKLKQKKAEKDTKLHHLKQMKIDKLREIDERRQMRAYVLKAKKEGVSMDNVNIKEGMGRPKYTETIEGKDYLDVLNALIDAHCAADARRRSQDRLLLSHITDIRNLFTFCTEECGIKMGTNALQ